VFLLNYLRLWFFLAQVYWEWPRVVAADCQAKWFFLAQVYWEWPRVVAADCQAKRHREQWE
jgi:hypothetical protein